MLIYTTTKRTLNIMHGWYEKSTLLERGKGRPVNLMHVLRTFIVNINENDC